MFAHFLAAQEPVYPRVLEELRAGRKSSHWMWFIFPQLAALGRSVMAKRFGLNGLEDAQVYAAHPVLGACLRECTGLANAVANPDPEALFGSVDALKYRSCVSLFCRATSEDVFRQALEKFYGGEEDPLTAALLAAE